MDFIPDFDFSKVFSNFDIVDGAALLVIEFIIIAATWQFVRKKKTSRPSFAKTVVTVLLVEVAPLVVLLVLFVVDFGISLWFALH